MIARSRTAHRLAFVGLAIALPVGIAAGLLAREPIPVMHPTDPALHGLRAGARPHDAGDSSARPIEGLDLSVERVETDGRSFLDLFPGAGLLEPDVLVYLSNQPVAAGAPLPADVLLLGSLAGREPRRLQLPSDLPGRHLVLFSLAHGRLLGSGPLPD